MGKNQNHHLDDSNLMPVNQGNQTSEDLGDGNRTSETLKPEESTAMERKPPHDRQDQDRIEELGEQGAGSGK